MATPAIQRQFITLSKWARLREDPPPFKTLAETSVSYGKLTLRMADRPYHAGEEVTGEVVLDYQSEVTVRAVKVKLRAGETLVTGSGKNRREHHRDVLMGAPNHNPSKHEIVNAVFQQEASGKLPLGRHTWQFSFSLPADALPSFNSQRAWLTYVVEASVDIPNWRDTETATIIEVRPSIDQHRRILAVFPNSLSTIPGFIPVGRVLGATAIEEEATPWNIFSCRCAPVTARLSAREPLIIPFRTGAYSLRAQLEISPARALVSRIRAELVQIVGQGYVVIQQADFPFNSQVEIVLPVSVDEEDMSVVNFKLYPDRRAGAKINSLSFSTNWYRAQYMLRVRVEMQGCTTGGPRLQAEVPVLHPEAIDGLAGESRGGDFHAIAPTADSEAKSSYA